MTHQIIFTSRESFIEAHARNGNLDSGLIDMKGMELTGINIDGLDLSDIDFSGSNMRDVSAIGADFECSNLSDTNIEGANFKGANLRHADFSDAAANRTTFDDANLDHAQMRLESWFEASFQGVLIIGTFMTQAFTSSHKHFSSDAFKNAEIHYIYSDNACESDDSICTF